MKNISIQEGDFLPNFTIKVAGSSNKKLSDFKGQYIILFFYPRDNTPGCTCESEGFRDLYPEFMRANTAIFGVSKDSLKSHEKFKEKYQLPYFLISDFDEKLCDLFEVHRKSKWLEKLIGLKRSTFLIGPDQRMLKIWRNVKVKSHAKEVYDYLISLQN